MEGRSANTGHQAAQVDPGYGAQTAFQPLDAYELAEPVGSMAGFEADALGHIRACPRCGAEDTDSARFCRGCGVGFINGASEQEEEASRRTSPALAVTIAAILILAVVAGGLFAYRALKPVAPTAPPAPMPAAAQPAATAPPPVAAAPAPARPLIAPLPPAAPQPQPKPEPIAPRAAAPAILDPVWLRRPSPEEALDFYPEVAADEGLGGEAVINCTVTALGRLSGCKVVAEQPRRHGFGAATLRLASRFRMRSTTRSGEPVAGRHVRVPVRWRLDD